MTGRLQHGAAVTRIEPWAGAPEDRFILPGFIDLHVHGGGGGDTMDGPEGVATLARFHARHGTTALLPTTVTAPASDLLRAAEGIAAARPGPQAARILGLHLEGPFINPAVLGLSRLLRSRRTWPWWTPSAMPSHFGSSPWRPKWI